MTYKKKSKDTRKKRKAAYIWVKNLFKKYPDCAYNGDFYCNHEYDEERGWVWVDFRFFHTRLKKYFSVAMTTLEYDACVKNEEIVNDELDKIHPYDDVGMIFLPIDKKTGTGEIKFSDRWREVYNRRKPLEQAMLQELNSKAQMMSPRIDVKDYGKVAVGLWVSLNTSRIDEEVIRSFIKFYRSIGEPTTPGRVWTGEEVEVVAERINAKHGSN